jgi:hypothetical protein
MSNGRFWSQNVRMQFIGNPNDKTQSSLLATTMGPLEVAPTVLPTVYTGNDGPMSADTIDLATGLPTTGVMRTVATLRKPFKLFPIHIADPTLTMATNQVTKYELITGDTSILLRQNTCSFLESRDLAREKQPDRLPVAASPDVVSLHAPGPPSPKPVCQIRSELF